MVLKTKQITIGWQGLSLDPNPEMARGSILMYWKTIKWLLVGTPTYQAATKLKAVKLGRQGNCQTIPDTIFLAKPSVL